MSDELRDPILEKVDLTRRAALKKLLTSAAFTVPVVASFAMGGLTTSAMAANQSNLVPTLAEWAVPVFGAALGAAALINMKKKKDA